MMLGWFQLFVLCSTCFISFLGGLSHTHPLGPNSTPISTSVQNVDLFESLRSSPATSVSNVEANVQVPTYRLKSTLKVNHKPDHAIQQSTFPQIPAHSLSIHPVIHGAEISIQESRPSQHSSKSSVEGYHKRMPIHESNHTHLQSSKTSSDLLGSLSETKSSVPSGLNSLTSSNKAHQVHDGSTGLSSSTLKEADLRQSFSSHVKRSVGDVALQPATAAAQEVATSPINQNNRTQDNKDSKPPIVAIKDNSSNHFTESSLGNGRGSTIQGVIGQSDGEMPNNKLTSGAMMRGFIVFVGCSVIVMVYLGLKFVCSRRQRRYSKVSRAEDLDLLPLTEEGDEEDEEIFSANRRS